jgi:lysozyme family protein
MAEFKIAVNKLLASEGGKVNDPDDPGGKTNFGITQKSLDAFHFQWVSSALPKDVFNLTREQASDFYFYEYWSPCRGTLLASQPLANLLLSMAVLQGKKTAVRRLQNLLGVAPDGIMGSKTLQAIESADIKSLLPAYAEANKDFFRKLVEKRPASQKFLAGWINRVEALA